MSRKMTKRDMGRRRHEIDEIEKSILQHHPPPEGPGQSLDQQRTHVPAVSLMQQKVPPSLFGRSSPVSVNSESSETETIVSQSYTSRSLSSASSWTDDVYEEETAQKVQELFDAIDSLLYEGIDLPKECKDLHNECYYWRLTFPHLRINGTKLSIENEQMTGFGTATAVPFTLNQTNDRPKVSYENHKRANSGKSEEGLNLMVRGMSLEPFVMPALDSNAGDTCNSIGTTYEEIIEQQGEYEELIAVDYSDEKPLNYLTDEIQSHSDVEIQLKQHIMDRLIKDIWSETISCLRPLLVKYISMASQGTKYKNYDAYASNKLPDNYMLAESSPVRLPTAHLCNQGFADLQGLLTISSKTLLSRSVDKNSRSVTQTSAPPAMVGARLSSSPRGINKSTRGRLAPLERSVRTSIPLSSMALVTQDNWKPPVTLAPPSPISPQAWGRHFPLPPIESGLQTASSPMVTSVQKLKPTCSAIIRMLSGSSNKRGVTRDTSKMRSNAGSYSNSQISKVNTRTNRLFSAQVDTIRSYPASYAAIGERVKSSSKFTDFRVQQEIINKGKGNENEKKERLPSGYSYNNFERRNNNR